MSHKQDDPFNRTCFFDVTARARMMTKTMTHSLTCSGYLAHDALRARRPSSCTRARPYLQTTARRGRRTLALPVSVAPGTSRQKSAARSRCPCSSDGGYNRLVDGIDRSRRVQHARSKVSCRTMAYLCSRRNANQEHRITRAIVRERSTPPTPRRLPRARRAPRRGSATREWHSRLGRVRIRAWHAALPGGTFWHVWRATRAHTSTRAVSRLARCVPITDTTGARAARSVWCG